jgi:predicted nucleic acid-binding protein
MSRPGTHDLDPRVVRWVVDSGVFVSLLVRTEPLHAAARAFFQRVDRRRERAEVPEIAIAEVLHVLLAKRRRGETWSRTELAARRDTARRFLAYVFANVRRSLFVPRDLVRPDYWARVADLAGTRFRRKTVTGNDAAIVALVKDRPRAELCTTETALLDLAPGYHVSDAVLAP